MRRTAHNTPHACTQGAPNSSADSSSAASGRSALARPRRAHSAPAGQGFLVLGFLALGPLLFGLEACAPIAVIGTAILVNDEFVDNAQTVIVPYDVDYVWKSSRSTLSHMTSDLLDVDNDLRAIKTYVDGAEVIVQVETFDVGQTRIRVAAKRYLIYSDDVAVNVRNRIDRDLN